MTLSAGNRTLLRAQDELELLHDMCRVIVETGGYRLAFVGYAEQDDQKTIRWIASFGKEKEFIETLHFTWADTELGRTATGTAIRTGERSVARNILTEPAFENYPSLQQNAIEKGYASVSAFPLHVDGQVIGALVMTAIEPGAFDEAEIKLLNELADDLAYGIENLRTRMRHRQAEATIARLAYYDPLTELPNRTFLLDALEKAIIVAKQQHFPLSLLHVEVSQLTEINKTLGYRAGDMLFKEIGQKLASAIQGNETLARVGETSFALVLPTSCAESAIQMAKQILALLRHPIEVAGLTFYARVNVGIAMFPGHATDAEALIRRANAAVHQNNSAHEIYAMYTGGQEQAQTRRLTLIGDLHGAVARDELRLYFQPKVDMVSRQVRGAEALLRWQHPQHGMVSTAEFINLAEKAGIITSLTYWVLDAAFSQIYAWHEAGHARALAVNLSAYDLHDPELIDHIRDLFSTWGISPSLVQFELTETALMADPAGALETLTRLKKMGVELFIDDYGTGYSSLSYLHQLPVDGVKIDQSFIMPLARSADSEVIVSSTIELGHNLGLKVVAEGVDKKAVWDRLLELHCDLAQGYLISMPIPADQFQLWETRWQQA
jgi:diguanylate cyclase (GGDEF)-like protein